MGKKVFANKMAVAAKAGSGKLLAAFPDVCNSPPSPPTGPLPVPYPNSAFSRDMQQGTKSVKIGGKPAATEDSHFETSPLGNEAATKSFGGSMLTHTITGKAYFGAYSMDVRFEGKKVVRHLDLMTSNHASYPGSTPPYSELEEMALEALDDAGGKAKSCPCCYSKTCAAALPSEIAPGVEREPLSFREFYRLDEVGPGGELSAVALARRDALASQPCAGGSCPNAGKPVRKSDPPCDVYRVTTVEESEAIDAALDKGKKNQQKKRDLRVLKGVPPTKHALAQAILKTPFAKASDLASKPGWSYELMNRKIQLDHTTPRGAGGCPTSADNIEAHDRKCAPCKNIDGDLDTWNGQELENRRLALGL